MCGRNSLFPPAKVLEERFDATLAFEGYEPRYNIAPSDPQPVITNATPDSIEVAHWGLLPTWASSDHEGFINARSETAAEKPAFRDAWEKRPCLVLSSGFYEWQQRDVGPKQPFRIHRPGDPAFAMAGLWEPRQRGAGQDCSITILTTDPNEVIEPIHDRMPVVLRREDERDWLRSDPEQRFALCEPQRETGLEAYPISRDINNPAYDDPAVIVPNETSQRGLGEFA